MANTSEKLKLKTLLPERTCECCGATFTPKTMTSVYCSRRCTVQGYKNKQREKANEEKLKSLIGEIPESKDLLSVKEACIIYNVSERTLRRTVKKGEIPSINLGTRLIRINRCDLEKLFSKRLTPIPNKPKKRLYSLEPEDCYTIGEIQKKFGITESTLYNFIRRESIPTRQIGKFVYVPKEDVDKSLSHEKKIK